MIKYRLSCEAGHEFESWFRAIEDYEKQGRAGLVVCPSCGSTDVSKQPMAPAVMTKRAGGDRAAPAADTPLDDGVKAALGALRALKKKVIENTEDVGPRFADEARKIHFGEAEERHIRGHSTPEETREMLEDGVPFGILPPLPEDFN
jgi:hypothetical protein